MKKLNIIIILFISLSIFLYPTRTNAKTLRDLYNTLDDLKAQQKAQESQKQQTQSEYNKTSSKIYSIGTQIEEAQQQIEEATKKIAELEIQIEEKKEQINELFRFYQLTDGENSYLEYIFGAQTFTDFIYRVSIVEQISKYNDELIDEMNDLIEQNKRLKIELAEKEKELQAEQAELESELKKIGTKIKDLDEHALDIKDQIKAQQSSIDYYVSKGCEMDIELSQCVSVPPANGLYRPLVKATVTSTFGYRIHPTKKTYSFHNGIDLAASEGTPVYATAAGRVVAKINRASCGGNILYLNHEVNGVKYTSVYMHLLNFNVQVGDVVTENDIIGYSGGGRQTMVYDSCTTGGHLHFSLSKGWFSTSSSKYTANLVNPADYIYMPNKWTTRFY